MRWVFGRQRPDAAFTLIEAVVAVMVVSIIVAVAIPAFQGFRRSAQDRAAQGEIDRVLEAEQGLWQEKGAYTAEAATLAALVPEAALHASDPAAGVTVSLNVAAGALCLERSSASGTTFAVWESAPEATFYGQGGGLTGACSEAPPAGYTTGGW